MNAPPDPHPWEHLPYLDREAELIARLDEVLTAGRDNRGW